MSALKDKEILVIDDARDVRILVRKILEADGATVFETAGVSEGLALASQRAPHLIITDLSLPGKTGFDLLLERKTLAFLVSIPTLVLSGSCDQSSISKAISMGATDYIIKPFRATDLLQKTRRILRAGVIKTRKFGPSEMPTVHLSVAVDILEMSESGCQIDSPVKLAEEIDIQLQSELLDELGIRVPVIRTGRKAISAELPNRYWVHLNFVGVGMELAQCFRSKFGNIK